MNDTAAPAAPDPSRAELAHSRVLLTRPADQAHGLAAAIRAQGGQAFLLPLLNIAPVHSAEDTQRVRSRIMALDQYEIAIFISTNAATLGLEWIENFWPQLPVGLQACAVGPGTAAVLRQLPWPVHCATTGVTSEDLLALPVLQQVDGKRIALFRGKGGRELLADTLRERGAQVDYVELYTREAPAHRPLQTLALLQEQAINAVVLTSQQIFDTFHTLLQQGVAALDVSQDSAPSALLVLQQNLTLVVPSARVEEVARRMGYPRVQNAGGADDQAVLACLRQCPGTLIDPQEAR
jgi:uroporphyrinogen-III synthase